MVWKGTENLADVLDIFNFFFCLGAGAREEVSEEVAGGLVLIKNGGGGVVRQGGVGGEGRQGGGMSVGREGG